jgi:hypothetical protein
MLMVKCFGQCGLQRINMTPEDKLLVAATIRFREETPVSKRIAELEGAIKKWLDSPITKNMFDLADKVGYYDN